ncbi:MAG TPA: KinB-signaling pathway activation protein [Bacillota bacterium]|nr:KinB-signaling pathway activation protein [Bacillota bacterium]
MNTRKLVRLFFTTLLLGGLVTLITSFFVNFDLYVENLRPFNGFGLLGLVYWYVLYGFIYSIISQAGFFAFLFINRIGLSIFRSFWSTVQYVLVAFVLFDLVYFPYQATKGEVALFWYILMAGALLVYGLIIARIKAKETRAHAFAPALFLMVVMTTVEWVPGLQAEGTDYAWLMIFALLACNTYQLLILHRLSGTEQPKEVK